MPNVNQRPIKYWFLWWGVSTLSPNTATWYLCSHVILPTGTWTPSSDFCLMKGTGKGGRMTRSAWGHKGTCSSVPPASSSRFSLPPTSLPPPPPWCEVPWRQPAWQGTRGGLSLSPSQWGKDVSVQERARVRVPPASTSALRSSPSQVSLQMESHLRARRWPRETPWDRGSPLSCTQIPQVQTPGS